MPDKNVVIVDYGMGNLFSVQHACSHVGMNTTITSDPEKVLKADALIFPGVGAFGEAMKNIHALGLDLVLKEFASTDKPFLGICLGLQLLFSESKEFGSHVGLDIIKGSVERFKGDTTRENRVPQIAWNKIRNTGLPSWDKTLLNGIENDEYMYFVHSFYVIPEDSSVVLCKTTYSGIDYCSGIKRNNLYAVQFHPEKSGEEGIKIYDNFRKLIN